MQSQEYDRGYNTEPELIPVQSPYQIGYEQGFKDGQTSMQHKIKQTPRALIHLTIPDHFPDWAWYILVPVMLVLFMGLIAFGMVYLMHLAQIWHITKYN